MDDTVVRQVCEQQPAGTRRVVTVETAAWAAVGALAAGLRFAGLGGRPLGENEAVQALAAFRFVQGTAPSAPAGTVPALFTANVAGFSMLGAGDGVARWLPAVAGVALALLPWGLRHRLGRWGALAAALLLAVSPLAVHGSRALDGAALVAACSLALAVGLVRYLDTRQPPALALSAGALGLGLCSGAAMLTFLVIVLVFVLSAWLLEQVGRRRGGMDALAVAWWAAGEKGVAVRAAAVGAGVFGLVATAFALHPAGVGNAADLLGAWVQGFAPEPAGAPAWMPLFVLLRYEALALFLAVGEAVAGTRRTGLDGRPAGPLQPGSTFPHTAFLAFWAVAALVLVSLAGHRPVGNLLLVVVPLCLLAGQGLERAGRWAAGWSAGKVDRRARREAGVVAAATLGLGIFVYLQVTSYSLTANGSTVPFAGSTLPSGVGYGLLVALAGILFAGLVATAWLWRGRETATAGVWLAVVVALALFGLKGTWSANLRPADPRELMAGRVTAPDVRAFEAAVQALSGDLVGDRHALPVTVDSETGPAIAWVLREFSQQKVVDGLSNPPDTQAAVTLVRQDLAIGEAFRGKGFPLRLEWKPQGLSGRQLLRWLLFAEGSQPEVEQQVVLWVAVPR